MNDLLCLVVFSADVGTRRELNRVRSPTTSRPEVCVVMCFQELDPVIIADCEIFGVKVSVLDGFGHGVDGQEGEGSEENGFEDHDVR